MNNDKQIVLDATKDIVVALIGNGHSISKKDPNIPEDYTELHSLTKEVFTTLESLIS